MVALAMALLLLGGAAATRVATHRDPGAAASTALAPFRPIPQRGPEAHQGERRNVPPGSL